MKHVDVHEDLLGHLLHSKVGGYSFGVHGPLVLAAPVDPACVEEEIDVSRAHATRFAQ